MKTFFLLLSLFVAGVGSGQPHQPIRAYIAEGDGMAPALKSNDRFLVDVTYYASHPIERGDIILFQAENDQQYVKRVIALPGETIEYKNDFLYIDHKMIDEPYIAPAKNEAKKDNYSLTEDFGPLTIPEDSIFVLGDNRLNTRDSRMIGPIHTRDILGKVTRKFMGK